jgi:hypothetical protein
MLRSLRTPPQKALLLVVLVFILVSSAKIFLYNRHSYFFHTVDERIYLINAKTIFEGANQVLIAQYPPVYSMLISPAFTFPNQYYQVVLILNALYSSSIVFIVYAIARRYLSVSDSLVASVASGLLPYHFFTTRQVFSENIYLPLLLITVFFATQSKSKLVHLLAFGTALAGLHLTRYISFVIVPVLIVGWMLNQVGHSSPAIIKKNLLILLLTYCILYGIWLAYGAMNQIPLRAMLGFHITQNSNPEQLTGLRLMYWSVRVLAVSILILAPILPQILNQIAELTHKIPFSHPKNCISSMAKKMEPEAKFLILIMAVSLMTMVAVIRHFWRVDYNYPEVVKFFSRYLLFLTPLWITTFVIGWRRMEMISHQKKNAIFVVNAALIVSAFLVAFQFPSFHLPPLTENILRPSASLDILPLLSPWKYVILSLLVISPAAFLVPSMKTQRVLTSISFCAFALIMVWLSFQTLAKSQYPYHAMMIVDQHVENDQGKDITMIDLTNDRFVSEIIKYNEDNALSLFWNKLGNQSTFAYSVSTKNECPYSTQPNEIIVCLNLHDKDHLALEGFLTIPFVYMRENYGVAISQ